MAKDPQYEGAEQTEMPFVSDGGNAGDREGFDAGSVDEGHLPEADQHIQLQAVGQPGQLYGEHRRHQHVDLAVQRRNDAGPMLPGVKRGCTRRVGYEALDPW